MGARRHCCCVCMMSWRGSPAMPPNFVTDAIAVSDIVAELTPREADRLAADAAQELDDRSPQWLQVRDPLPVTMAQPSPQRDAVVQDLGTGSSALGPWLD